MKQYAGEKKSMIHFDFSGLLIDWQRQYGRNQLPWQSRDPYRIWVSEIMLQQTQVKTVLEYYPKFLTQFPTVQVLAEAPLEKVLACWSGLGYYSRARNMHKAAQQVMREHAGQFPTTRQKLETLSGVGRSTAAAIAAFAYQAREAILDGNVKRVLARVYAIAGIPSERQVAERLWALAETLLPAQKETMASYTQGLMDLGALVCLRSSPKCEICPMQAHCQARLQQKVADLPEKPPRKVVPERQLFLLVAQAGSRFYLVNRPEKGIWGGLYCFPESDNYAALQTQAAALGTVSDSVALSEFVHVLTHFRLVITPVWVQLGSEAALPDPASGGWFTCEEALQAGIPVPVRKIFTLIDKCNR